jgi:hypothetical protein
MPIAEPKPRLRKSAKTRDSSLGCRRLRASGRIRGQNPGYLLTDEALAQARRFSALDSGVAELIKSSEINAKRMTR